MSSIVGDIDRTYAVMCSTARVYVGVKDDGQIGKLFFHPRLTPVYLAHLSALDRLFACVRTNPADSAYWLAVRQLVRRGYWCDKNGIEVPGLPPLPAIEDLLVPPRQ